MKQTAVKWLINELNQKIDFIPMDKWDMIRDIVQQALEIEKQQIMNAYGIKTFRTIKMGLDVYEQINGEQYYNETYKSTKK
jgi:hypothetical protein